MHIWLLQFAIFCAVFSGGLLFPHILAERPRMRTVSGMLALAGSATLVIGILGNAVTYFKQLRDAPEPSVRDAGQPEKWEARLQTELRRLGCYSGAIDGVWGQQSRIALGDLITASRKDHQYGDTVPVEEALQIAAAAPNRFCRDDARVQVDVLMRKYKAKYNSHLVECVDRFFFVPIERKSQKCITLRQSRDRYAKQLEERGILPPG